MSTAEAPGRLHLGYRLDAGVAVVTVTGEVDVVTCGVLRDGLLRAVTDGNGRGLVVNLAEVSFLDSTGLGVLVGVWHRVEASSGRLAVAAPSRQVRSALNTAGLTKALSVYDLEALDGVSCPRTREPVPTGTGPPSSPGDEAGMTGLGAALPGDAEPVAAAVERAWLGLDGAGVVNHRELVVGERGDHPGVHGRARLRPGALV